MKHLFSTLSLLTLSIYCFAQFHIKAIPSYFNGYYGQKSVRYSIVFTPNDWKTVDTFKRTILSYKLQNWHTDAKEYNSFIFLLEFSCKQGADSFVKQFSNYSQCIEFNLKQFMVDRQLRQQIEQRHNPDARILFPIEQYDDVCRFWDTNYLYKEGQYMIYYEFGNEIKIALGSKLIRGTDTVFIKDGCCKIPKETIFKTEKLKQ